jgi:Fur family ferric uptake transcriptional regulator
MAYLTEQRKLLYSFFEQHPHDSFCVKDIYAALSAEGISISAIYRNLSSMKKDGVVRCYADEGSRDIYYRFVNNVHCADAIHLTCTDCGKTFHMSSEAAEKMQSELEGFEGFRINKDKTVLYGTCKECVK